MSVLPYQFEPSKKISNKSGDSNDEWEDVSDDDGEVAPLEEDIEQLENRMSVLNRVDVADTTQWCKCNSCSTMPVNRECLCCTEIDEIRIKKLTDGMFYKISIIIHNYYSQLCNSSHKVCVSATLQLQPCTQLHLQFEFHYILHNVVPRVSIHFFLI